MHLRMVDETMTSVAFFPPINNSIRKNIDGVKRDFRNFFLFFSSRIF